MAMAMSPDGTADRGHHLLGGALGGLVPRCALQCCNRSRYPAGRQPQPLPGGARSDPVGVLLDHGQVPGRDGRQGHHLVGDPLRRPSPLGRVIVGRSELQCCNRSRHPAGQQPQLLPGGARSDPVGVLLNHGQVPGRDGRQGNHLAGYPVRRPGSQGQVIAGRSELQCCNRSRCSVGRRRCRAGVTGGALLGHVPGRDGRQGHHLVGYPVRRPGPQGRVIAGRSVLQCCNRSRHPAGRQPQPLPGGARSDPVGVLLDHGQVPGRNGRQRPSPGGRPSPAAWP